MSKLPEKIFVVREGDGDDEFLNVSENIESFAEMGEKQIVGVYQLVENLEVEGTIEVRKVD